MAERRAGELLARVERQQGKRGGSPGRLPTLATSDIADQTAKRWRAIARVPEAEVGNPQRRLPLGVVLPRAGRFFCHRATWYPRAGVPGGRLSPNPRGSQIVRPFPTRGEGHRFALHPSRAALPARVSASTTPIPAIGAFGGVPPHKAPFIN